MLSSFEKEELVCFSWQRHRSPELQLLRKKADKTEGLMSIMRLTHYRLSGVQRELCSQVFSGPS